MRTRVIREKQDLTYLNWSHIRSSSGTAGTFLKSESSLYDKKIYIRLQNYVNHGIISLRNFFTICNLY